MAILNVGIYTLNMEHSATKKLKCQIKHLKTSERMNPHKIKTKNVSFG